jgi:hypothetical protein
MTRLTRNWDLLVTSSALAVVVVGVAAPHVKRLIRPQGVGIGSRSFTNPGVASTRSSQAAIR